MLRLVAVSIVVVLGACAVAGEDQDLSTSPAPLVGVDGSSDQADRNCNVVLRGLNRNNMNGFAFETNGTSWVWSGEVEISAAAAAEGLVPSVMYQWGSNPAWHEGTIAPMPSAAGVTPGFVKFAVRLDHDLLGPGMSASAITSARIQVVPYLRMAGDGRLFDHNRNASDFDNYVMTWPDLAIWHADAVCAAPSSGQHANLVFSGDHTQHRDGVISAGGTISILYDVSRLPCRNSQGGNQLWDITAHVRFEPTGQLYAASVRDGLATFTVPSDGARRVAIWFENTSSTGCHEWDSNLGNNYVFDVATSPQWVGNASNLLTRDSGDPCIGGSAASTSFGFDTWARQRAAITNLCFEVYQPGLTDRDDPELWQKLDASVRWHLVGDAAWHSTPANLAGRAGNNARYAMSWRALDPFRAFHCPERTPTISPDGQYGQLAVEYVVVVNGLELRPVPGGAFAGVFTDYRNDPFRDANCGP